MVRIVQISDTHLSPTKRHFESNWQPLVDWVHSQQPDLVVHTGDITVDGADLDEDLAYCRRLMSAINHPFLAIPGNHDVGDARHPRQPVNRQRIERWARHFGPDRWIDDIAGWRLVGFNAQLAGSNSEEERLQAEWLERACDSAQGRRIAWLLHKPLFLERPDEGDNGYWAVKAAPRQPLNEMISRHRIALVASGHLHKSHEATVGATRFVWGPSGGFVCGPKEQPPMPGSAELGAVVYELSGDTMSVERVHLDHLARHVIDDVIHEVYPRKA
jgi:3',5'-cyclic AMP phosphodiesterase CpdA